MAVRALVPFFLFLVVASSELLEDLEQGIPKGPAKPTFGGPNATAVPNHADDHIIVKFKKGAENVNGRSIGISRVPIRPGETLKATLKAYQAMTNVEYAEYDHLITPDTIPNDPSYKVQWGMTKINAPDAWNISTGSDSVTVCVVDSGVDAKHPDLAPNMHPLIGYNAIKGDSNPVDDLGHGTHVAGIIGAMGNNGIGTAGVNWRVKILACKFMDARGLGLSSDAVECINYCLNNKVKIISASWSFANWNKSIKDAISAANSKGVLFVSSAGNKAANLEVTPVYPPNYGLPNQIVVASSTSGDGLSGFSNYGKTVVHIAAPGENIMSTLFKGGTWGFMTGTSMATPIVAGAAALILGANDQAIPMAKLKSLLLDTVDKPAGLVNSVLTGRLDLAEALKASKNIKENDQEPAALPVLPGLPLGKQESFRRAGPFLRPQRDGGRKWYQ